MSDFIVLVIICLMIGVPTEWAAARLGLWRYRLAWVRPFNIVVTFGLVYGAISWFFRNAGPGWLFVAGAVPGLVNELQNEYLTRAWYFPGKAVPWLKGKMAVLVIGTGWGLVPLLAVGVHSLFV